MTWDGTYSHNVLYGVDILGAIVFWNTTDITISSMCGIVMFADQGNQEAQKQLEALKLYRWQANALRRIGPALEKLQPGHCQGAINADYARAQRVVVRLQHLIAQV